MLINIGQHYNIQSLLLYTNINYLTCLCNFVSASIYRFLGDENITRNIMKTNYPKVKENYSKVARYCYKHSSGSQIE